MQYRHIYTNYLNQIMLKFGKFETIYPHKDEE